MDPEPDSVDELIAAAQQTEEQARAALALAGTLWRFYEALTTAGFPPDAALALTHDYFGRLWQQALAAAILGRQEPPAG